MRSETGFMANGEPFSVGIQKPTVQSPPSMQNMRLTFTPDGTAVYKPITTTSPPPQPPSYQGGGAGGAPAGAGGGNGVSSGATGGGNGLSPVIPSPHGLNINMGEPMKRKRGRPRKYGPDGTMALALTSVSPPSAGPPGSGAGGFSPSSASTMSGSADAMKKRGRPPGSGRKLQMAALGNLMTCLFIATLWSFI